MRVTFPRPMTRTRRRGAVLLVVLAMLALFAVVGLSFVFYAESRATSARIFREAQSLGTAPDGPDSHQAALTAMAQLIYDVPDTGAGAFSSMRGHSLARLMFGGYYEGSPLAPIYYRTTNGEPLNGTPYNGVGPIPGSITINGVGPVPRGEILNYKYWAGQTVVDPEWSAGRATPNDLFNAASRYVGKNISSTYPDANDVAIGIMNPVNGQMLVKSFHRDAIFNGVPILGQAGYQALNDYQRQMMLAPPVSSPGGQPGTFVATAPAKAGIGTGVDDWNSPVGRYRMVRPRPIDHLYAGRSDFPFVPANADGTYTGDVQNIRGAAYPFLKPDGSIAVDASGNPLLIPKNDALWMDLGYPVEVWNGRRVKPLFAFTVLPLNNRVNINASGNVRGQTATGEATHDSGQGLTAAEIGLNRLFRQHGFSNREYLRIKYHQFGTNQGGYAVGSPTATAGLQPTPPGHSNLAMNFGGTLPPNTEAPLDWDGGGRYQAMRMLLPGQTGAFGTAATTLSHSAFALAPRWAAPVALNLNRYDNGDLNDAIPAEQVGNPAMWNPYFWKSAGTIGRLIPDIDLHKLNAKWADDSGATSDTILGGSLAPLSFGANRASGVAPSKNPANALRHLLTTRSNSLALPSMMPMMVNAAGTGPFQQPYAWPTAGAAPIVPVAAGNVEFPTPTSTGSFGTGYASDFEHTASGNVMMRSVMGQLPPVDVNRALTDYRHPLARAFAQNGFNVPLRPDNMVTPLAGAANYTSWLTNNNITGAGVPAFGGTITLDGQTRTIVSLMAVAPTNQLDAYAQATLDRQNLARDIFARLVVATGAAAVYDASTGYCTPLVAPNDAAGQYDALRYLAQLAANIVDYIDGDDVTTMFVWNPDPATLNGAIPVWLAPANVAAAGAIPNRVVFGVEKPKLTVNEAYAEMTNNVADSAAPAATRPFELRFWIELLNPGANDLPYGNESKPFGTVTNPQTNPAANAVLYYGPNQVTPSTSPLLIPGPYSTYFVDVHAQSGTQVTAAYAQRNNVLGSVTAVPPDLRIDFLKVAAEAATGPVAGYAGTAARTTEGPAPQQVGPVGTKFRPDVFTTPTSNPVKQGYLLLAPGGIQSDQRKIEYNPTRWDGTQYLASTPAFNYALMVPQDPTNPVALRNQLSFEYRGPFQESEIPGQIAAVQAQQPTVVLRRLANPYLPPNDPSIGTPPFAYDPNRPLNPYLAVDTMTNVVINDAVAVGSDSNPLLNPAAVRPDRGGSMLPPVTETRRAVGKAHPLAALPAFTRPIQLTVPPAANSGNVYETFFRHNSINAIDPENPVAGAGGLPTATRTALTNEAQAPLNGNLLLTAQGATGSAPRHGFEWMPFLDRPLVNPIELLHVPGVPSHLLTERFITGTPLIPFLHQHTPAWTGNLVGGPTADAARMSRALELLQVKPWTYATPIGGRVAGKININMITDPRILLALADPHSGDMFKANYTASSPDPLDPLGLTPDAIFNPTNPLDNTTNPTTYARYIAALGGSAPTISTTQVDPVTGTATPTFVPGGPTDRPIRSLGNAAVAASGTWGQSYSGVSQTVLNSAFTLPGQSHPYNQRALLRKMYNNLTTTTECYEVYCTVGFFEVRNPGPYYTSPNWTTPILGKEIYKDVPGDMRHRFFSIIDRTRLNVNPATAIGSPRLQGPRSFHTEIAGPMTPTATAGQYLLPIYAHGQSGNTLLLRYDEAEDTNVPFVLGPTLGSFTADQSAGRTAYLKLNFGATSEWVRIEGLSGTFNAATGVGTLIVTRNTGLPTAYTGGPNIPALVLANYPDHAPGTSVSNVLLGNPGPQPNFDPAQPTYRAVMPYFTKLDE